MCLIFFILLWNNPIVSYWLLNDTCYLKVACCLIFFPGVLVLVICVLCNMSVNYLLFKDKMLFDKDCLCPPPK